MPASSTGAETVIAHSAVKLSTFAVIVAVPSATAVTSPVEDTVATELFADSYVTVLPSNVACDVLGETVN